MYARRLCTQNLAERILWLRYRDAQERPQLAKAGARRITNAVLAGRKLWLEGSSSEVPQFDRNLNTGEKQAGATRISESGQGHLP
jgi:predicted acyl esterase